MSDEKKGGYGLLKKLQKVQKKQEKKKEKPTDKPHLEDKKPETEEISRKKPVSAPSRRLDIHSILSKEIPKEKKKEKDETPIVDDDFTTEAERKIDELLGEGEDDVPVGVQFSETEEDILAEEELPVVPVVEESYEDFELPVAELPPSVPVAETEENKTESLGSEDLMEDDVSPITSSDIIEEDEMPTPEEDETPQEKAHGPPPLPKPRVLPSIELFKPEEEKKETPKPPAPPVKKMEVRAPAYTISGAKAKPSGEEDVNEKYAISNLGRLGYVYTHYDPKLYSDKGIQKMVKDTYNYIKKIKDPNTRRMKLADLASREARFGKMLMSPDFLDGGKAKFREALRMAEHAKDENAVKIIKNRIKGHELDKEQVQMRVTSDSSGLPRVSLPASKEKGEDDGEKTTDEAKTRKAAKKALEELPVAVMPAAKEKDEAEDDEETRVFTKAAEVGISITNNEWLEIFKYVERRLGALGLVDAGGKDVNLDDFAAGVVEKALKNNPRLLAGVVSELIKKDEVIRSILFNEKDGLLKDIPAEVRRAKEEVDQRVNSLKGLEENVNNLTSAAQEARDAAQKAEAAAAKVDEAKRYADEQIGMVGETVEELIGDAKDYTNEQIGMVGETVEELIGDKIETAKEEIQRETDEKIREAKSDAVEEAKSHTGTQVESVIEEVKQSTVNANAHAESVAGEKAEEVRKNAVDEAKGMIVNEVNRLKEKTIEPIEGALKAMLGNRYEKAKVAGEAVDAIAVTAAVGALADAKYIEGVDMLGKEYGKEVIHDAVKDVARMSAERLAESQQMYNERGELDVERAEKIITHANKILNR
jgi:hypothetical protein